MACPACNVHQKLDYYSAARKTYDYSLEHSLEPFVLSNAAPSHNDCALIKDSLSSLSAKSAHLDDIIAQHDEAIAKSSLILDNYKDSHEEMLSEQARVHDLLERYRRALSSPIRRLPVDIMREIFLQASSNAADVKDFAWIATHTCTEWRDIATQTPILWSKIHVITETRTYTRPYDFIAMPELEWLCSTSKGASNVKCVGRALELSRDVPLVISYIKPARRWPKRRPNKDVRLLDILLNHAPRWRVAYLDACHGGALFCDKLQRLRGRVPMLESISIDARIASDGSTYPHDILDVAPRLCTVAIRDSQGQLVFPWQQIRRLILNGFRDMSYFLHVLRSVKNVEHLTICPQSGPIGLPSDTTNSGSSIILRAVHILDVLSGTDPLFLPSELILPALEKLQVVKGDADSEKNTITPNFMSQVGALLKSSGCVLTHATLLPIVDFGPAFEDVILQCPTLTYLDVGFITPLRENIDEVFSFINWPNMLPALRTLKIAFRSCNLAKHGRCIGERFVQTALSRKHSRLRIFEGSVHLEADLQRLPYKPILSATDKASLEELKAEGMSITVRLIPVYRLSSYMIGKRTEWKQSLEFA